MRNGMRNTLVLLLAACLLAVCAWGAAEPMHEETGNDALDMKVSVGYDGMMTYGKYMPVRVRIRNTGGDFEGVLGMNAYINKKEYDRYEREVFVPAASEREFVLAVTVYSKQDAYTAELVKDGGTVCTANGTPGMVINPSAMMIGVLSTRPQNLKNLTIGRENDVLGRYELWQTVPLEPETFPEDTALMNSFGMLVIDDVDPALLSQKQQDALESWLRSGRVLICGGGASAARNTAFFSRYTGLKLEEVTASDTALENLEQAVGRAVSGRKPTCALARYSGGGEWLAKDAEGNGLICRTKAGAGRIYTAAFETGDLKLNSESLMGYFWQQLLVNWDMELYSAVMYSGSEGSSAATVSGGYSARIEARSFLPAGMLIVAGVIILGCVIWVVLKKKDKRQWMWLALPLTAAAAAAGILLLSTGAETNRPLAVIADNLVQDSSGAIRNYSGVAVATPDFGRHSYSLSGERLRVQYYDYVDYDEEEEENQKPDSMRSCYTAGAENIVTAESLTPWELINLSAESPAQMQGRINGTIWMEEDGLHGEIENGTDTRFAAGYIVTTYGYVSVPPLAPGEKTAFTLIRTTFRDPDRPVYEDGGLYPDHPGLYSVISNAVGYDDTYQSVPEEEKRNREMTSSLINGAADVLRHDQGNWSYGAYESALFLYTARPESAEESVLKVDGVPVKQKTGMMMLTAELPFAAIGKTGVVYRSAGMDIPERVETDGNRMPTGEPVANARQMYYHALTETPTFRFSLSLTENVKAEKLQVLVDTYYAKQCKAFALNVKEQKWEEIKLNEDIDDPGRFLDRDGTLFLQFRSNGADMYADIPTPLVALEGRLEHAED